MLEFIKFTIEKKHFIQYFLSKRILSKFQKKKKNLFLYNIYKCHSACTISAMLFTLSVFLCIWVVYKSNKLQTTYFLKNVKLLLMYFLFFFAGKWMILLVF